MTDPAHPAAWPVAAVNVQSGEVSLMRRRRPVMTTCCGRLVEPEGGGPSPPVQLRPGSRRAEESRYSASGRASSAGRDECQPGEQSRQTK
ncbi:unnamed protein product [Heligmosomoides polygyrus]|uniref:Uncharacterized protein n=1 Tax=Heligmosomoides polygyrus TaxID=6339 RepID=A0A183FGI0_HELPZ|nr:unnamed protein product [Heligmosomoides polygyrus]